MSQVSKRDVPPVIKRILEKDAELTKNFVLWANKYLPFKQYKTYYKGLEISCHGVPWYAFWICFTWLFNNQELIPLQVNMLLGLFLDILFVAFTKAYTRRRRPAANTDDALGQIGPDVFSFPSGHASRAVLVACLFTWLYPLPFYILLPTLAWATAVCVSRVLLCRHHVLDVVAGVLMGMWTTMVLGVLWLGDDTCIWLMSFLSDEKMDGGEYHV